MMRVSAQHSEKVRKLSAILGISMVAADKIMMYHIDVEKILSQLEHGQKRTKIIMRQVSKKRKRIEVNDGVYDFVV